jgi:hypothetical protein
VPLDISTCNTGTGAQRLWTLMEAPAGAAAASAAPAATAAAAEAPDLSGAWTSNWGPVTLAIASDGSVTGSWVQPGDGIGVLQNGIFDGDARTLTFSTYQRWDKVNGTAKFVLSADGKSLLGTWSNPGANGGEVSGPWNLTR